MIEHWLPHLCALLVLPLSLLNLWLLTTWHRKRDQPVDPKIPPPF